METLYRILKVKFSDHSEKVYATANSRSEILEKLWEVAGLSQPQAVYYYKFESYKITS